MHLIAPWWWLLALPLIAGLIVLYLLKLRRRDHVISSVYLWEQALHDFQANTPLQKLRVHLLLFVQLLIILLAVAALSRPAMQWLRKTGNSVVLVIDASASMQSTDVTPSRFAAARAAARKEIEALGMHDRMMLVSVGGVTRALTPFTNDKRTLNDALDRLRVTDAGADLRGALDLAMGLVSGRQGTERPIVVLVTDGALPPVTVAEGMNFPIHLVKIGTRCDNVGIIALDVRRQQRANAYQGLLGLKNFSDQPRTCVLELTIGDQLWDAREITIAAGGKHTEVLDGLPVGGGILHANLDVRDDLAVDNAARIILPTADPVPVILASTGDYFLKTALTLDPTLQVTETATLPATIDPGTVLVAENVPLSAVPEGVSALLIGSTGAAAAGALAGTIDTPVVADWDRRHPVLRHVDLTSLFISSARQVTPTDGAQALITTGGGPIAVARDHAGQRLVYLGWDFRRSDFPLRPGFPIFIGNCIDWLSHQRQRARVLNLRTGHQAQLPVPPTTKQVTLHQPDGTQQRLDVAGSLLTVDHLTRAGIYRVTGDGLEPQQIAANLLDTEESNLLPRDDFLRNSQNEKSTALRGSLRTEQELWRIVLLVALAALCLEWWMFHRRVG